MRLAIVMLLAAFFARPCSAAPLVAEETVELCALVSDPARYDGRVVRVTGTFSSGFEESTIRSNACKETPIWVEFDQSLEAYSDKAALRRFRTAGEKPSGRGACDSSGNYFGMTAKLRIVGRFHGVKKETQAFGRTFIQGFGHMGGYDYQLDIFAIEKISRVNTTGPDDFTADPGKTTFPCEIVNRLP